MKKLQFRCKLLSDIILNTKSASEGNQNTLDFIPGNNFLGIVARDYEYIGIDIRNDLFHNGMTRFGDAHPVEPNGKQRSLRIPASMFYPKLSNINEKCYIHHFYSREADHDGIDGNPQQLKQCRNGFYVFGNENAVRIDTPTSYAIKSAYERTERKSADSQMYGYESLRSGAEFLFEVECDNDKCEPIIIEKLTGTKRIGRSRTAQYGLVEISACEFTQPESTSVAIDINGEKFAAVYADSRLIFIDSETNEFTLTPQASDFGINGKIDWEKSQVRTFQYSPWNGKRQTREADRCGIEKGSVIIIGSSPNCVGSVF